MKRGVSFYLLIVLAVAVLAGLVVALSPGSAPDTPAVILSPPPSPEGGAAAPSEAPVSDAVIDVTPQTVQTAIRTLSRADSYSRILTVQRFWNGGSSTEEILVQARGGYLRLTVSDPTTPEAVRKNILLKDDRAWIWYSDSGSVWHGPAQARDADAYQTLLTYEDVLKLPQRSILDAGYTGYNGEGCIYVRYESGSLGYTHQCYISDATGLLMGAETYDGDVLVYSMRSTMPEISTPGDEVFVEPQ